MIQQAKKLERRENILSSLDRLQYATVKQINRLHSLSSDRNCYRILKELKEEKLVDVIKREMNIYYLTKQGRELVGSEKELPKSRVLEHILMRNDLYIYLGNPLDWKIEYKTSIGGREELDIISDAHFTKDRQDYYVEIDHTNPMKENRKKLMQYEKLNVAYKRKFGRDLNLIFYVMSQVRKRRIEQFSKVPVTVYTVNDLK